MELIARISSDGRKQFLKDHSKNVAHYTAERLKGTGFVATGRLCAILHDMGKASEKVQAYLRDPDGKRGSVIHSFQAGVYMNEQYYSNDSYTKLLLDIIFVVTGAHHGLFDIISVENIETEDAYTNRREMMEDDASSYKEAVQRFFDYVCPKTEVEDLFQESLLEIKTFVSKIKNNGSDKTSLAYAVRIILSALIYADHRDSREFESNSKDEQSECDWKTTLDNVAANIRKMQKDDDISRARNDLSKQYIESGTQKEGIKRCKAPTGSGKTFGSLLFGLKHNEIHLKKRLIVVSPLLTVTDQNAKAIRSVIPESVEVLEHHSDVINDRSLGLEAENKYNRLKSSWDSPIIITTMARLLEVLNGKGQVNISRMSALVDSTIVIDEVQQLPLTSKSLTEAAIKFLSEFCKTTVVHMSATLPPLKIFAEETAEDIVKASDWHKNIFKNTDIYSRIGLEAKSAEEIAEDAVQEIRTNSKALFIECNTKAQSRRMFRLISEKVSEDVEVMYISTWLCKAQRLEVIDSLKQKLKEIQEHYCKENQRRLILISTQIIEAGIDVSFDTCFRLLAGLDNTIQAAGRCNRSGEYPENGRLYIYSMKEENLGTLTEIRKAQKAMIAVIGTKPGSVNITDEQVDKYYTNYFGETEYLFDYPISVKSPNGTRNKTLYGLLKGERSLKGHYLTQPFRLIADTYNVYENDTINVVVPYKEGISIIEEIKKMEKSNLPYYAYKSILKKAEQYVVALHENEFKKFCLSGAVSSYLDGTVYALSDKAFDKKLGVITDYAVEK